MPEQLDPLVSISAAAREIGVHQSTLSKQVREGAVRSHDGRVRLSEVLADRAANIDLGRSNRRRGAIDNPGATAAPVPAEPDVEDAGADDGAPEQAVIVDGVAVSYAAARAMKEGYLARLKQLEFETKRGALVSTDDAVAEFTRVLGVIRERLLAMPGKLGGTLTREHVELVRTEIHDALEELSEFETGLDGAEAAPHEDPDSDGDAGAPAAAQPRPVGRPVPARRAEDQRRSR